MFPKNKKVIGERFWATGINLAALTCCSMLSPARSMLAHNIQTKGNVAATFHIEPNHNPKAGQSSRAWFALTRRGGQPISLSQCDCRLAVYAVPRSRNPQPILQPTLKAIAVEQYKGVPGTEITFPKAGGYDLVLTGKPKQPGDFPAFQFTYSVNVR
ncbi:hypothetical protein BST81_22615 [Leptolyngbya sp. 'hensonii']|uniref:hypothetical protein n=1 Tax=Leptolyngbya sp. 'hensonii' TaxID=1922337 RepID=UPI00094FFD47|nr:hypothetical protein [Leptolyngbya sp. 'hensonii']OLP16198.1 hypothetical protein BST81_22615 [Leptolyngbya sp. 'hensonii']